MNEKDRPADSAERANGCLHVALHRVEAVLRRHHLVAVGQKRRDQLVEEGLCR